MRIGSDVECGALAPLWKAEPGLGREQGTDAGGGGIKGGELVGSAARQGRLSLSLMACIAVALLQLGQSAWAAEPTPATPVTPTSSAATSIAPNPSSLATPAPSQTSPLVSPAKAPPAAAPIAAGPASLSTPSALGPLASASASAPAASPSQNVTINLINRLVQRGALSKEDAADLIKQAEQDTETAKAQAAAQAAANAPPEGAEDAVRVTYIPDTVKQEMHDQIKEEVMAQAREENWAQPRAFPEWLLRVRPMADLRIRYEADRYPAGNDNTGAFTNFNGINTGSPYDTSASAQNFQPLYNVDQNRERLRFRARFGAEVDLTDGFGAGLRIGTGQDDSPVSENQSFGLSNNGQGGNFSKYAIWLDRAFLNYQFGTEKNQSVIATLGRFENPFMHTSMLWSNDLAFEGLALQGRYEVTEGITPFVTAGAFPIYNTDYNFASNQPSKFKSEDKWLYAIQAGSEFKINQEINAKGAVAYYDFDNIEGHRSDPVEILNQNDPSNTDDSRPSFAQNGNTYRPIRNIILDANNDFGGKNQYQYFGLATPFREVAVTGQIDYSHFDPFHLCLRGEAVQNVAFSKPDINAIAVNNRGNGNGSTTGGFDGGNYGYLVNFILGHPLLTKRWDWNVNTTYRYVESDATVDGFTDSDFGANLAGTNLKGYTIGGSVAVSQHISFALQYMSADSIAGPPYRNDLIQFDINAKF